ncbi:MAG: hypothetical protein H6511_03470 [Holophagales bacterium]|nr:hypothetical protein [Holophagales bacterium]
MLVLSWSAGVGAAQNAFANPDFDQGIGGWSPYASAAWWSDLDADACEAEGVSSSGSYYALSVTVGPNEGRMFLWGDGCLNLAGDRRVAMEAMMRGENGLITSPQFYLEPYPLPDCQGTPYGNVGGPASIGPLLSGGYRKIRASFALSVFVFSVKGGMGAEGTQGFDVYWDRAYLGTSSPVFLDDFEAESTCRWSATASP